MNNEFHLVGEGVLTNIKFKTETKKMSAEEFFADTVEPEDDGIKLISIFGDQKFVKASIHSLSLVDHKIFLKE